MVSEKVRENLICFLVGFTFHGVKATFLCGWILRSCLTLILKSLDFCRVGFVCGRFGSYQNLMVLRWGVRKGREGKGGK